MSSVGFLPATPPTPRQVGASNQLYGINNDGDDGEFKTLVAGANVGIVHGLRTITIASGEASALGWFNVKDYLATGNGTDDDTASIQAAIDAAETSGGKVFFPVGIYKITDTLTVENHRVILEGAVPYACAISFMPTAHDKPAIRIKHSTAVAIAQCGVRDLTIISSDTAYRKIGLQLVDISQCVFDNVQIQNILDTTEASIGIQLKGRDTSSFRAIEIYADIPFDIQENPNHASIDCDCMHFEDLYTICPTGTAGPHFKIAAGVVITNTVFDGFNVFCHGSHGIYQSETSAPASPHNLVVNNLRWESGYSESEDGHILHLTMITHSFQGVSLRNLVTAQGGVYIRGCENVRIEDLYYTNATKRGIDIYVQGGSQILNARVVSNDILVDGAYPVWVYGDLDYGWTGFYHAWSYGTCQMSFWGVTPISQPTLDADPTAAQISTVLHNLGLVS